MTIYNLTRKADIWWQDIKRVKGIKKKNRNWSTFKKYFKKKLCRSNITRNELKNFMTQS